jgi:hypothetical protein
MAARREYRLAFQLIPRTIEKHVRTHPVPVIRFKTHFLADWMEFASQQFRDFYVDVRIEVDRVLETMP